MLWADFSSAKLSFKELFGLFFLYSIKPSAKKSPVDTAVIGTRYNTAKLGVTS